MSTFSVPTLQIPLQHSIQDSLATLERITMQLNRLSDAAAYPPMNAAEYSALLESVRASHAILKGVEATVAAEIRQWGVA